MFYNVVADVAVAAHSGFLALGILGGFVAWRWRWVLWLQVVAAAWLVLVVAARLAMLLHREFEAIVKLPAP